MSEFNELEEKRIILENPQADLERLYLDEYLREKGYAMRDLGALSEEAARQIMIDACRFVSLKLAEMESRAHLRYKIHDATHIS